MVQNYDSSLRSVTERIKASLSNLNDTYGQLEERLRGIAETHKTPGNSNLNNAADFFGVRFRQVAGRLKNSSYRELQSHRNRVENLHGLAASTIRGTPEMRGFTEQYQIIMRKIDDEIKSRKKLTFRVGDFLKKNSIDTISITSALTTRNPLIGLGVKYILERRKAMKELDTKNAYNSIADSVAYRRLLRNQADQQKRNNEREEKRRRAEAARNAKRSERESQGSQKATKPPKETPGVSGTYAGETKRTYGPREEDTILDAEFEDIPNTPPTPSRIPRMLNGPSASEAPKPKAAPRDEAYDYDRILLWARAQKRVSATSIQRTWKLRSETAAKIVQRLKGDGVRVFEPKGVRVLDLVPYQGSWSHNPEPGWFQHESGPQVSAQRPGPRQLSAGDGSRPRGRRPGGKGLQYIKVQDMNPDHGAVVPYREASVRCQNPMVPLLVSISRGIDEMDKNLVRFHKEDKKTQESIEEERIENDKEQRDLILAVASGRGSTPTTAKALVPRNGSGPLANMFSTFVGSKMAGKTPKLIGAGAGIMAPAAARGAVGAFGGAAGAGGAGGVGGAAAAGVMGGGGGASGILGMMGTRIAGSLLALAIDGILGWFKDCEWGTSKSSSTIGGILGGTLDNTVLNTFANMGKYALVGATLGSVVPGLGTLAGGILGAAFGGIMGYIGGKNIARFFEASGAGRMISSWISAVTNVFLWPVKRLWKNLKAVFLGLKVVWRMIGFMYDIFIKPLVDVFTKTLEPILKPALHGLRKVFDFFTGVFDWISNITGGDSSFDQMVDKMLSDDNVFETVLGSFQQAFLNFAAGLLEKIPKWIPGSGFLHDTAKGFRKKSDEIGKRTQAHITSNPPQNTQNEKPTTSAPIKSSDSMTTGEALSASPKIKGSYQGVSSQATATPLASVGDALTPEGVNANPSSGTLSQSGLDAIKRSEGFSATPYWDSKGYSIGYGHLLTPEEYAKYKDRSITKEEAEQLLLKDTEKTQNAVNQSIKVPLTQDMFDALVSFGYNLGPGAIKNVAQTLNTGDYEGAAKRMRRYVIANGKVNTGLIARRKEETGKFLASMKPQQGQTILNMQKQNEDGRAEMQSKGQQGRGNTVVSAPKTNISSTSVIAPQQDPRNNDSTYRTAQNKNYR